MTKLWRAKLRAFYLHLLFSAALIGIFMYVVMIHWFPGYLFTFENVWEGLRILVPVDAILGPLLTLIIFAPDKKGLKGDLAVIVVLQIAALMYGGHAIYGSKPEVLAFVGDRFEVVPKSSYLRENVPDFVEPLFESSNPTVIYPLPAMTLQERELFVVNNIQYQSLADRYRPVAEHQDKVLERALDINRIKPVAQEDIEALDHFRETYDPEKHALFVLQGTTKESIILSLNMETFKVQDYLPIDPWEYYDFPER